MLSCCYNGIPIKVTAKAVSIIIQHQQIIHPGKRIPRKGSSLHHHFIPSGDRVRHIQQYLILSVCLTSSYHV